MSHWKTKITGLFAILLVALYVLGFSGSYGFYLFSALKRFFLNPEISLSSFVGWATVGVSVSLLASLCAWPFALSIATLLEHNKARRLSRWSLGLTHYMASMPLLLFVYVYVVVIGPKGFQWIQALWTHMFASPNFLTKMMAFGLTLVFYPITAIPGVGEPLTIDLFYREMLQAVIEFAEVSLVAAVVVVGLFLFVLPKMVLQMREYLLGNESLKNVDIIKSIGGTPWESIHLTLMQSMKERFNQIISYFTRVCFFEGLITFTLLNLFALQGSNVGFHWSTSLSSLFVSTSTTKMNLGDIQLITAGGLVLFYLVFLTIEYRFRRQRELANG